MLRLPPLRYHAPRTLDHALELLAGGDGDGPVRLLAGGTDLLPNLKRRNQRAATVVSLARLAELRGVAPAGGHDASESEGPLRIGAMTTLAAVAADPVVDRRYPGLTRAVRAISSPVLRNMGTLGGNLCLDTRCTYYDQGEEWRRAIDYCMKEQGKVCWVAPGSPRCWAISATDAAPMLCALDAEVELAAPAGRRAIPLAQLYRDDGIAFLTKRDDEILTAVEVPAAAAAPTTRTAFWKLRRRGSIDFGVLSVAVALWPAADGCITRAHVVLGAVASAPIPVACDELLGRQPNGEVIAAVAAAARKRATPMDNTDFQTQWRGVMVERYVEAALREAAGLPVERLPPAHV